MTREVLRARRAAADDGLTGRAAGEPSLGVHRLRCAVGVGCGRPRRVAADYAPAVAPHAAQGSSYGPRRPASGRAARATGLEPATTGSSLAVSAAAVRYSDQSS